MRAYTFSCALAALGLGLAIAALPARAGDLYVEVTGLEGPDGAVNAILYDTSDGFGLPFHAIARVQAKPRDGKLRFALGGLPEGRYALVGFHDLNRDDMIDKDAQGRPTEAYGFSNGAKPAPGTGRPDFAAASVHVPAEGRAETRIPLAK